MDRPAKDYASTRYSTLDQITTSNVKNLKLALTFSTGMTRGHEAAPLVVNNTMYIVTPFPNSLYALDLTKPGAPIKWVYEPQPTPASQGVACCDVVNRGRPTRRQNFLQHPGRSDSGGGRQYGKASLEDADRGHQQRRVASRWLRSSPREKCWLAIAAANWEFAAG